MCFFLVVALLAVASAGCGGRTSATTRAGGGLVWISQLGSAATDIAFGVHADGRGNVYLAGSTEGTLAGDHAGDADAFIAKFNSHGRLLWKRQFGTAARDSVGALAVDRDGNVYTAGITSGSLGGRFGGEYDAFVAKFDAGGKRLWIRQPATAKGEYASSVTIDNRGGVYIAGDSFGSLGGTHIGKADAYVIKFDSNGNRLWSRQLGTRKGDVARVHAGTDGHVYLAGETGGRLGGANAGGSDAFLVAYTADGDRLWAKQLGSPARDYASSLTTDARGGVFIAGVTAGDIDGRNRGRDDAFIAKYDGSGNRLWTKQVGTPGSEQLSGISAENRGGVFISGGTTGALAGSRFGAGDAFLARYDANGSEIWTRVLGTSKLDAARAVNADGNAAVYIAVQSAGRLTDNNAGGFDAILAKYSVGRG